MRSSLKRIFDIIQSYYGDSVFGRAFDMAIMVLILVSIVIAFAVTFDLPSTASRVLTVIEQIVAIVFTVEYLLRLWVGLTEHIGKSKVNVSDEQTMKHMDDEHDRLLRGLSEFVWRLAKKRDDT